MWFTSCACATCAELKMHGGYQLLLQTRAKLTTELSVNDWLHSSELSL